MDVNLKAREALKRQLATRLLALTPEMEEFYNRCHDIEDGEFCSELMRIAHDATRSAPERIQAAVKAYTKARYREINGVLRGKRESTPETQELIRGMDEAFQKHSIDTGGATLYRGLPVDSKTAARMVPGAKISDKGFVSTSAKSSDTSEFTVGGGTVIIIKTKKGQRAIAGKDDEHELILPRGTVLRIKSRKEKRGYTEVVAEIIDEKEAA